MSAFIIESGEDRMIFSGTGFTKFMAAGNSEKALVGHLNANKRVKELAVGTIMQFQCEYVARSKFARETWGATLEAREDTIVGLKLAEEEWSFHDSYPEAKAWRMMRNLSDEGAFKHTTCFAV